ncbi:MAG: glycosyltransferase family 2 protein, partial [Roseburia sp.]|nr:glycosyltransferase family 2 protein [Roseburia sp.]
LTLLKILAILRQKHILLQLFSLIFLLPYYFLLDFNIDLLCSMNYICHLFAAERRLVEGVGGFDGAYDGAQDLDFFLRCCEAAKKIHHIPKILYHWRCHIDSTAANPESKLYAFEAGRRAVEAHYRRLSIPARVENAQFYGMYRTIYEWEEEPLVSIIIPNKDHAEDLAKCMNSIFEKSDYRNFEFVIVENNSSLPETFDFYHKMEAEHENVHVVYYEGGFNYSAINNFGVRAAKGEYLMLLNNDTEIINESCIRELLGCCMREDVGIVGAKLLYEDETIQHAGVVIGFGGTAGHAFIGKARYDTGYFGRILCAQDYSAVTAACLMTKRSVYEEVGGLTEELAVAFNDVDYCLKVRETGKLVVYNPYAELFHYESKSRGYEDSPEKVERFNGEVEKLLSRWRDIVENGDPYYNPNLTLDNSDFSLRR